MEQAERKTNSSHNDEGSHGTVYGVVVLILMILYAVAYFSYGTHLKSAFQNLLNNNGDAKAKVVSVNYGIVAPLSGEAKVGVVVRDGKQKRILVGEVIGSYFSDDVIVKLPLLSLIQFN